MAMTAPIVPSCGPNPSRGPLKRFNSPAKYDTAEVRAVQMASDKAVFKHRDANHNGSLTRAEFMKGNHVEQSRAEKSKNFDAYDQNGDGKITKKEWSSGRAKDRKPVAC